MNHRAYSVIDVKSMDDEQRVIRGMATTPTPDRAFDVINPFGVKVAADIPLFMHHKSQLVVGRATLGRPTEHGIPFEARIPKIAELGLLRDRVDEAWQSVKYKLITAVSIGFQPVMEKVKQLKGGGLQFDECEVLELSLVPIPMQAEALITQFRGTDCSAQARTQLLTEIKSADQALRRAAIGARPLLRLDTAPAVTGNQIPGDSGQQQRVRRKGVLYLN